MSINLFISELEDIQNDDRAEEKVFTYMADLTHDGTEETVIIDISHISKDNQQAADIYVNDTNGSTIWKQEAYLPSAGWTSYYLCKINGEAYLLYYMPSTGQGIGHYEYKLFYLNNKGSELKIAENTISFDAYPFSEDINFSVADMVSFANDVNQYLNQG